ncbi:MAG: hypothetical protein AB7N76_00830 [Planctomycetota bacterium]
MTPAEHEFAQLQLVSQTADRLGVDTESLDEVALLHAVERQDADAFRLLERFRSAYREWFDTSVELQRAVEAGGDVEGARQALIGRIMERDRTRRLLVSFLDAHYPRGGNQRYGGDIVAASGIPI